MRQYELFGKLKETIQQENTMIAHLDFAENYSFVVSEEFQGIHWTNRQMTIHSFYCQWADEEGKKISRTITILSNC